MHRRRQRWTGVFWLGVAGLLGATLLGHEVTPTVVFVFAALFCTAILRILAGTIVRDERDVRRAVGLSYALDGTLLVGLFQLFVDLGVFEGRPLFYAGVAIAALVLIGAGIEVARGDLGVLSDNTDRHPT